MSRAESFNAESTPEETSEVRGDVVAFGAAVFALCLWSATTTVNKVAVSYLDGLTVGVLRSAMAGVLAAIVAFGLRVKRPRTKREFLFLLISGWTSFAIWPSLLSLGIDHTTAGHAGLVMAMIPVMTVLFGHLGSKRLPSMKWWMGAGLALLATVWLMLSRGVTLAPASDGSGLLGDLIVFSGVAFCAIGYVAGGRLSAELGAVPATLWSLVVATMLTVPTLCFLAPSVAWAEVPTKAWSAVLFLTLISSFLGYGLWFFALGRGGVQRIGSLQLAMPAMSLAVATLFLGERLAMWSVVAAVVLIGGTVIAHRFAKNPSVNRRVGAQDLEESGA